MAAALRWFRVGAQSLWIDESFTWARAEIGGSLGWAELLENVHGPLHTLIIHSWGGLVGDAEWALRAPSVLAGTALVPALAWLALRWLGRDAVIPAAWFAAASPLLVWYGQEARNYALLILWACVACALCLELGRRFSWIHLAGYVVAVAAGMLSNFSFALLAPLHIKWWGRIGPGGASRAWALAGTLALVALVLAPWWPQVGRIWDWQRLDPSRTETATEEPLRGSTTFHPAAIPFALHSFAVGYTYAPPLRELRREPSSRILRRHLPALTISSVVFGVLGILGIRALARRRRLMDLALWLLLPALVISYFALQNFKVFHPRYLAVSMPGFLLLLAAGIATAGKRLRLGLVAAVAGLWAYSLFHHYFDPRHGKEDYRGAAALLAEHGEPGEKVLAAGASGPLFYYYRGPLPLEDFWLGFAGNPDRLARELELAMVGSRGAWLVVSRPEDQDPTGALTRRMGEAFPRAERFAFEGIEVWHVGSGD